MRSSPQTHPALDTTTPADIVTTTTYDAMPPPPGADWAQQIAEGWPNCATENFRPTFDVATGAIAKLPWPVPDEMIAELEALQLVCGAHTMWVPPESGDTPVGVVVRSDYAWPACWPSGHPPTTNDAGTIDPPPAPPASQHPAASCSSPSV